MTPRDADMRTTALETLIAVTEAAHLARDEDDLARAVNDALLGQGHIDAAAMYRLTADAANLELVDDEGMPPGKSAPHTFSVANSINGQSITSGQLMEAFDVRHDDRIHPVARDMLAELGVGSLVAVPVLFRRQAMGSLALMWREVRSTGPVEREAFLTVGRIVGLAMHSLRRLGELKQAGSEAETGHEQLRLILETVPLRLFWKDRTGRYTGCNLPFVKDTGLTSVSDVIGKTDDDMPWQAQAKTLQAIDLEVMRTGQPRIKYELDLPRVDGSVHKERVSKMPVRDRNGDIVGVLGCYEDVTERLSGNYRS